MVHQARVGERHRPRCPPSLTAPSPCTTPLQLEDIRAEFAAFRPAAEAEAAELRRQLVAAEVERAQAEEKCSAAVVEVEALQQQITEVQAKGTPKVRVGGW